MAEIQVSVVEAPEWWRSAGNGLDLADDNLLAEVWSNVLKIKMEALQEVHKKAEESGQKIETVVANQPK